MKAADMIGRHLIFLGQIENVEYVLNSELREPTPMHVNLSLTLQDSQHVIRVSARVPFTDMAEILESSDA